MASAKVQNSGEGALSVFFPTFIVLFLQGFLDFVERICLSHYSLDALNANLHASSLLYIFQVAFVIFAYTLNVFLGGNYAFQIGNRVWQVIWVSLLGMVALLPLSLVIKLIFFNGNGTWVVTTHRYFNISIMGSFLFPIAAVLSSFFKALNKKKLVITATVISAQVSVVLFLLFIPRFGVVGAAYGNLMAKFLFCAILFGCFLTPTCRALYHTHHWQIDWATVWRTVRKYNPKVLGRVVLSGLSWAILTYCMAKKSEDYLSNLSVGATFTFLAAAFQQGMIYSCRSLFINNFQSRDHCHLKTQNILKFGLLSSLVFCLILAVPLLLFPQAVISTLFPSVNLDSEILNSMFWAWVWICIAGFHAVFRSLSLAISDNQFYTRLKLVVHLMTIFQVCYSLFYLNWKPSTFWVILCVEYGTIFLFSLARVLLMRRTRVSNWLETYPKT